MMSVSVDIHLMAVKSTISQTSWGPLLPLTLLFAEICSREGGDQIGEPNHTLFEAASVWSSVPREQN